MTTECIYSRNRAGLFVPDPPVEHREAEYDPDGFGFLRDMQARHFWYLGRQRFLLRALTDALRGDGRDPSSLAAIDLGGGCGGWVQFLRTRRPDLFGELALADSSIRALTMAEDVVGSDVPRYQIDLLRLMWDRRWDVAFLLDVLEHIPQDVEALRQVARALRPGGLLIVTTPALDTFWSYNDDLVHHVRRYSRADYARLASESGLRLVSSRYFMFLLSPLLLLSRLRSPDLADWSEEQARAHLHRTHRVPVWPVNQFLRLVFSLETPLGHWLPFPWGTSILGVFRKET